MGRTLQNTMVNLALENACDEAVYQVHGPQNVKLIRSYTVGLFILFKPVTYPLLC